MHTSIVNNSEVGIRVCKELVRDLRQRAAATQQLRHRAAGPRRWLKSAFQHAAAFVVLSATSACGAFFAAISNLVKEV